MKILLLTQYFPPETGAPQNRLYNLATRLMEKGNRVTILTGMPNYPAYQVFEGYRGKFYVREQGKEGLEIHRCWLFVSRRKSIFARLVNQFSFVFTSLLLGAIKLPAQDLIICESPPLFLGWTAVLLARLKKARLVFNVSDLFPESALKLGMVTNPLLIKLSTWLEEWIYRHADLITGQTQGIVNNIQSRMPEKPVFWLSNGVDNREFRSRLTGRNWRMEKGFESSHYLVYFGGLLGYSQGLDVILHAATRLKNLPEIQFVLVGEGPEKERLMALKETLGNQNVHFFPGVPKNEVADVIQATDAAVIPLRKVDLFLGAIPSKIYEILSLGKPVLLGVDGEAKTLFIRQAQAGQAFEPENDEDLANKVLLFYQNREQAQVWGKNGSEYVSRHFDQTAIAERFLDFVTSN